MRASPLPSLASLALSLALAGCANPDPGADTDAPVFGRGQALATYLVSSEDAVEARELARVAKVIGPYRELTASELAALEKKLTRLLDRLVEVEFEQMKREATAQQREVAAGRAKPPRRPLVPSREAARARLLARLGKDLALPLLTSDNRSAVVFGRVSTTGITLSPTAYEIQAPKPGEVVTEVSKPDGERVPVVETVP